MLTKHWRQLIRHATLKWTKQGWKPGQVLMQLLKLICEQTAAIYEQAMRLPRFLAIALKRRQRQFALNALEAERLDRIRNPSKYLGR